MARTKTRTPQRRPKYACQFLVVLPGTDPLVWRRILVPEACSFWDLHVAIQDAMGWMDAHLHEFGDDWEHTLELEGLEAADGGPNPRCVACAGACPPEDVGGTVGYADFLQIMRHAPA